MLAGKGGGGGSWIAKLAFLRVGRGGSESESGGTGLCRCGFELDLHWTDENHPRLLPATMIRGILLMMNLLTGLLEKAELMVNRMEAEQWAVVGLCLILLGFFSMRGHD